MPALQAQALPGGTGQVARFLLDHAHPTVPVRLQSEAKTAQQAADLLGVDLGQIAKSVVFRRLPEEEGVLVIMSGDRRVDEAQLAKAICTDTQTLARADAAFVRSTTGFAIGGVAPLALAKPMQVLIDASVFRFREVWAAAGHPQAVFASSPERLGVMALAALVDVAAGATATKGPRDLARIHLPMRHAQMRPHAGVLSPCNSICTLDARDGLCDGCLRTADEIAAWGGLANAQKHAVWQQLLLRAGHAPEAKAGMP
jgi:prolyl-tRNA editing enzyme YbaK/EbsC (Cys-tRNA(Pro) deacylase)/predicted Fe-S protein YdhL (DUF1289 family)